MQQEESHYSLAERQSRISFQQGVILQRSQNYSGAVQRFEEVNLLVDNDTVSQNLKIMWIQ